MFKYEYVTWKAKGLFDDTPPSHHEIINEYAKKGFRYVGCIPLKYDRMAGKFIEIDFVFEMQE